jgi:hypothetical protein
MAMCSTGGGLRLKRVLPLHRHHPHPEHHLVAGEPIAAHGDKANMARAHFVPLRLPEAELPDGSMPVRNRWFADSPREGAGFEPSVPLR